MPTVPARLPTSATLLLLLLGPLGCANPGQPRPPSLHIPAPVTALRAQRIGDAVRLTWSTPADSTDGQGLRGPVTALVCRDLTPAAECRRVAAFPVLPGPSAADDPLPAPLLTGPPALLVYRIQLLNSSGRSAPPSAPVFTVSGAAPPPIGPLRVQSARQGALLTWSAAPEPDSTSVEVRRTLVAEAPVSATATAPSGSPEPVPVPGRTQSATAPRKSPPTLVVLRAEPPSAQPESPATGEQTAANASDASGRAGLRDPGVKPLSTYSYTAQRVRTVQLAAPAGVAGGPLLLEMRGLPSPPATLVYRDVFPPRSPAGLVAIAGPGDPTAHPALPASIDLSWELGLEPDLLGYNLYRASSPGATFRRLNPQPLPGPAFRDLDVHPGTEYLYRVTAVDRSGNESAPSPPLRQTVPRP